MSAYYNEHDPEKAAWLRELIAQGHIAAGEVDERDIKIVQADELAGFTQCHFFAGIGVWSYALRLAGWPDNRPVWTGSCPCPSFSAAGKGEGFDDPRHLWPAWARLIRERRPPVVFGEQADDAIGYGWLDLVQTDLEAQAYAVAKAVLGACSVGGSDIRQRLYFVADAAGFRFEQQWPTESPAVQGERAERISQQTRPEHDRELSGRSQGFRGAGGMADAEGSRERAGLRDSESGKQWWHLHADGGGAGQLEHTSSVGRERRQETASGHDDDGTGSGRPQGEYGTGVAGTPGIQGDRTSPLNGPWRDADWLLCRDGKWRPVEPGTFPLAHGAPFRVGRLRGYGDAINAEVAKTFIECYLEH